jgi:hypothetical protein
VSGAARRVSRNIVRALATARLYIALAAACAFNHLKE